MAEWVPRAGGSGGPVVPSELMKLVPVAATLVTIATNPVKWATNNLATWVKTLIAEWLVGGILDAAEYAIGWIVYAYEKPKNIILDAIPVLDAPFEILESNITGALSLVYWSSRQVAEMAGLAGPPAAAVALALTTAVTVISVGLIVYIVAAYVGNYTPYVGPAIEGTLEKLEGGK